MGAIRGDTRSLNYTAMLPLKVPRTPTAGGTANRPQSDSGP